MNFTNASFSSCKACDGNSDDSLFWRLRSDEVFYNEKTREIEYQNVWLDIFGHPVMYFPYFSHPSPEVKRRTGFLIPTIESTTSLGATVKTPYYWEINPHKDITLTPMFTSDEGMVMIANYRQMFASGQLTIDGSITEDSRNNIRDNIDLKAETAINDNWRATLNIERASDETYLRKYGFDDSPWLTSKGQLEGFFGSSYASVTGYSFQELRSTITEDEPLVLPVLNYNYVGDPGENYGERIKVDLNSMSVYQGDDTDSSRLSAKATIEAPYYMPKGDIYTFSASIRGDGYVVNDVIRDDRSSWSGVTGRVHPQLAAKWRYPFIKQGKNNSQTIEPIVEAIISPNGNNSDKIPNIDSRDLEFDDTNVLGENKFSGLDRIESGNRVNYGVKWNYYDEDGKASVFVGQSYHLSKDTNLYPAESGLNKHFSDFVGRVDVSPTELLDVSYRFRMDARGMDARLQEVYLETGKESLNLALDYMFVNASNQDYTGYEDREEIGAEVNMSLAQNWYAGLRGRHDLTSDGGAVEYGGHVKYKDECVELGVDVERSYTEDRDYEEGLSVMFTVILKNLGGVSAQ
jgi:LPS-assembly protein